jgi:CDP-alcohol phosphatidyltransferase
VHPEQLLVLADESANWKIAGLRQLDRLALAIDCFAAQRAPGAVIEVRVFWKPGIPKEQRWLPNSPRLANCRFTSGPGPFSRGDVTAPVLSTHLFIGRSSTADWPIKLQSDHADVALDEAQLWEKWARESENIYQGKVQATQNKPAFWEWVADQTRIAECEKRFLRTLTKSQDGLVSRFLNRPISRLVSRVLLRLPIAPSAWTLSVSLLLPVAFLLLLGSHFIIALVLFQIYSILDGCDGEIARAKYLESARGRLLDTWCDVAGNLLLVIGLGLGLQRQHEFSSYHWRYVLEGALCALFIAANELLSHSLEMESGPQAGGLDDALYSRHRQVVKHSGLAVLGEKTVWWVAQLTKRDVATLFFLVLAVVGLAQWILHLSIVAAAVSLTFAGIARLNVRSARRETS